MDKDRLAQLIAGRLARESTPEELKELDDYLRSHPADDYFVSLLHDYWLLPAPVPEADDPDEEARLQSIFAAAEHTEGPSFEDEATAPRFRKRIMVFGMAAAALTLVIVSYFTFFATRSQPVPRELKRELVAKSGSKSRLLLPDGSTVWLNAESRLSYRPAFSDSLREVELEGEAYFDVVKNPARPFIVHTSGINIRVLGTAFNVRSYPTDHAIEATLIRGLIEVTKNHSPDHSVLILHPHEKVVVEKEAGMEKAPEEEKLSAPAAGMVVTQLKKGTSDTAVVETAWVYNKLVFDGDTFREIADQMERWFNVKIRFHNEAVAKYRFHVGFENETLQEVLEALQVSAHFTFKISNNEVDISG